MSNPVTTKERKKMRELYALGLSTQDVAKRVDRSPSTVYRHVDTRSHDQAAQKIAESVIISIQEEYDAGATIPALSDKHDISQRTLIKRLDTKERSERMKEAMRKKYWSETWEKAKRAAEMRFSNEMHPKEIANEMGVSTSSVYRYLRIYRNPNEYAPSHA